MYDYRETTFIKLNGLDMENAFLLNIGDELDSVACDTASWALCVPWFSTPTLFLRKSLKYAKLNKIKYLIIVVQQ